MRSSSTTIAVVLTFSMLFFIGAVSLQKEMRDTAEEKKPESTPKITKVNIGGEVQTVKHDEHLLIVHHNGYSAAIIHHPSCPCLK